MKAKTSKERIVEENLDHVWLNGYHNTSIKDVVERSGILKGSFYNYFRNKDQFIIDVLQAYKEMWIVLVSEELANHKVSPRNRFKRLVRKFRQMYEEYEFTRGCLAGNLCQEMGDLHPEISASVNEAFEQIEKIYESALSDAIAAGEIDPDTDTRALASFLLNALEGVLMRMKSSKSVEPFNAYEKVLMQQIFKK